jgi:hypothetical protein
MPLSEITPDPDLLSCLRCYIHVRIVVLGINFRGPFADEMIAVLADKAVHPGVTHAVGIEVRGKFLIMSLVGGSALSVRSSI